MVAFDMEGGRMTTLGNPRITFLGWAANQN